MMAATNALLSHPPDFSAPWKFSDVVLIVEDQKFHVHRSTLAFWSPVFEKMFTTDLKEKNSDEIPIPEKKASEFKELLQMMYPSLEEKLLTTRNCYFLFELAHEYQIESISQKCEALMVSMVKNRIEKDVLAMLVYGQKYQMKTLISTCIYEARRLKLKELKQHRLRDQIEADNYLEIAEGIIQRLEEKCEVAKNNSAAQLLEASKYLYSHCTGKGAMTAGVSQDTPDWYLTSLCRDVCKTGTRCESLASTARKLQELKLTMQSL